MAQTKVKNDIVKRNITLTGAVMRYLLENPKVFKSLPEDDPEIRLYNLELLDKYGSEGKPVVFARLTSSNAPAQMNPSIFVPVAA
jgi:hypothetical protein